MDKMDWIKLALTGTWMSLLVPTSLEGGTIHKCSPRKNDPLSIQCAIRTEVGIVGDSARVLDERARVVAEGRLVKRRGNYGLLILQRDQIAKRGIKPGYPVIVNVEGRQASMHWAAAFD